MRKRKIEKQIEAVALNICWI